MGAFRGPGEKKPGARNQPQRAKTTRGARKKHPRRAKTTRGARKNHLRREAPWDWLEDVSDASRISATVDACDCGCLRLWMPGGFDLLLSSFQGRLVQVGKGIELDAVGRQFEPYRWAGGGALVV